MDSHRNMRICTIPPNGKETILTINSLKQSKSGLDGFSAVLLIVAPAVSAGISATFTYLEILDIRDLFQRVEKEEDHSDSKKDTRPGCDYWRGICVLKYTVWSTAIWLVSILNQVETGANVLSVSLYGKWPRMLLKIFLPLWTFVWDVSSGYAGLILFWTKNLVGVQVWFFYCLILKYHLSTRTVCFEELENLSGPRMSGKCGSGIDIDDTLAHFTDCFDFKKKKLVTVVKQ